MKKGEIYWCDLPKLNNDVIGGHRPCVIVSADTANLHSSRVIVIPFTTAKKRLDLPCNILLDRNESVALCDQLITLSKNDVHQFIGRVVDKDMKKIHFSILVELGLI